MTTLIQSLEQLVNTLERRGRPMRSYLQAGLLRSEIEATLAPLGISLPSELVALYEWHDGIDRERAGRELQLFGDHNFLPLADAISAYRIIVENYSDPPSELDISRCFPFAGNDASYRAIYCYDAPLDGLFYPIIGIFYDISIIFENMEIMAHTAIEWIENGIYDASPVDEVLRRAIWQRLNPKIRYRNTSF